MSAPDAPASRTARPAHATPPPSPPADLIGGSITCGCRLERGCSLRGRSRLEVTSPTPPPASPAASHGRWTRRSSWREAGGRGRGALLGVGDRTLPAQRAVLCRAESSCRALDLAAARCAFGAGGARTPCSLTTFAPRAALSPAGEVMDPHRCEGVATAPQNPWNRKNPRNLILRWVPELNEPRSEQSQLPKDTVRSGGLVMLTKPAGTVKEVCGECGRAAQAGSSPIPRAKRCCGEAGLTRPCRRRAGGRPWLRCVRRRAASPWPRPPRSCRVPSRCAHSRFAACRCGVRPRRPHWT